MINGLSKEEGDALLAHYPGNPHRVDNQLYAEESTLFYIDPEVQINYTQNNSTLSHRNKNIN